MYIHSYDCLGFRFRDRPDPNRIPSITVIANNYSPTPSAHAPIPRGINNVQQHTPPNMYPQAYGRQSGPAPGPNRQMSYPQSRPGGSNPGGANPFGDARNGDFGDGDGVDIDGDAVLAAALQASKLHMC